MNSGRDPDPQGNPDQVLAQPGPLWRARWFRTVVVFSAMAVIAGFTVPCLVRRAAEREGMGRGVPWVAQEVIGQSDLERAARLWAAPLITRVSAAAPIMPGSIERGAGQTAARESASAKGMADTEGMTDLYWVQVGVFRDADAAKRVAQRLRDRKYRVQESTLSPRGAAAAVAPIGGEAIATRGSADRYEVIVTGEGATALANKVAAKGLASRGSAEGIVITPSLPLSEAVALSRELADDGLAVRVRRVGSVAKPARTQEAPRAEGSRPEPAEPLYRVRVGGFADRAAAQTTLRELEGLGYKPFLARGSE